MPQEYTASDRVISVRAGADFVVVLAANPTTGHEWEAHFDAALVQLIDRVLAASGSGIGSGGTERFRFKALGPGDGQLRMTCPARHAATKRRSVLPCSPVTRTQASRGTFAISPSSSVNVTLPTNRTSTLQSPREIEMVTRLPPLAWL